MLVKDIKNFYNNYIKDAESFANALRTEPMPRPTEELFSEFETCGNRVRYEAVYFGRRKFLTTFGLAVYLHHRREDIARLEEIILDICSEECWALPAHVNRKDNSDWRNTIDLFASETAQTLAHMSVLFANELSGNTIDKIKKEVFSRVLTPFLQSKPPYADWEKLYNNWNAVCCGNVGSAGLYLIEDEKQKRELAERIASAMEKYYIESFGDDGACEEGLGYWVYGFTYYILFMDQVKTCFNDIVYLKPERLEQMAYFQQKCYFEGGRTISFSDGDSHTAFPMGLTCRLAFEYPKVEFPDINFAQKYDGDACWRWIGMFWTLTYTDAFIKAVESGRAFANPISASGAYYLADAEWAVMRKAGSAIAAKGGNNGESHNHNDVGSFFYMVGDECFLDDLGAGEYTRDYFSKKRYEIFCNRGLSHNIPIIDEIDQRAGANYCASDFKLQEEKLIEIEFSKAYGIEALKSLKRSIYLEDDGGLTVCDEVQACANVSFEENLITLLPVRAAGDGVIICGKNHDVRVSVSGVVGEPQITAVSHSDHSGKETRVYRICWRSAKALGTIRCEIRASVVKS